MITKVRYTHLYTARVQAKKQISQPTPYTTSNKNNNQIFLCNINEFVYTCVCIMLQAVERVAVVVILLR